MQRNESEPGTRERRCAQARPAPALPGAPARRWCVGP